MLVPGSANPLLLRSAAAAATCISRSIRLNAPDSAYLSRTPASAGNRKTWTWAGWVKRAKVTGTQKLFIASSGGSEGGIQFYTGTDNTSIEVYDYTPNAYNWRLDTTAVFRDPGAWLHIVYAYDSTQATSSDRIKLYINGTQITAFSTSSYPSQNFDGYINNNIAHNIGAKPGSSVEYFDGYLADIYFIDGSALTPSSFTETDATTGQLIPKAFSGSYGSQGWHLEFADNSSNTATTLGKDTSGNSNNWTPNNLSVTAGAGNDSLVDVPTNGAQTDTGVGGEVRGNYCTWNPLDNGSITLANGNLDTSTTTASNKLVRGTIGVSTGKWYWEVSVTAKNNDVLGVANRTLALTGVTLANPGDTNSSGIYTASFSNGSILGFALDLDSGKLFIAENNTWKNSGNPVTGANPWSSSLTSGPYFPAHTLYNFDGVPQYSWNFGQRPFAYTAPSGFKALCTANLPAPLVTKPNTVFDVALYTANVSGGKTITLPGSFGPGLVWIKNRDNVEQHYLADRVRGDGSNKYLRSNSTNAEGGVISGDCSITFNTNGFTLTDPDWTIGELYFQNRTYAGFCWDAGSSTVTNTQGSITSSVRANATAGFSIVTFTGNGSTGATVGHGLGVAPKLIIEKSRTASFDGSWWVHHANMGSGTLRLNSTDAVRTDFPSGWINNSPTSSTFSFTAGSGGTVNNVNISGDNYVAYCFAPVVGYSSFGSYVGNGSSDGVFVYTGFRPRWVLIKQSSASGEAWFLLDTARSPYNVSQEYLVPNASNSESSAYNIMDILSNGFKLRATGSVSSFNGSGATYIYAAFAESPLNYSRAR
jgi:hypothetical protein